MSYPVRVMICLVDLENDDDMKSESKSIANKLRRIGLEGFPNHFLYEHLAFTPPHCIGCVTHIEGQLACILSINTSRLDPDQPDKILSYIVHEITHVKQYIENEIGSTLDKESEAYLLQNLFFEVCAEVSKYMESNNGE